MNPRTRTQLIVLAIFSILAVIPATWRDGVIKFTVDAYFSVTTYFIEKRVKRVVNKIETVNSTIQETLT